MMQGDFRVPADLLTAEQRWAVQDAIARKFLEGFKLVVCRMRGHLQGDHRAYVTRLGEFDTVEEALQHARDLRANSLDGKEPNTRYFIERKGKKGHRDPEALRHQKLKLDT